MRHCGSISPSDQPSENRGRRLEACQIAFGPQEFGCDRRVHLVEQEPGHPLGGRQKRLPLRTWVGSWQKADAR